MAIRILFALLIMMTAILGITQYSSNGQLDKKEHLGTLAAEFDKTSMIVISELLFDEYEHAKNLAHAISDAGAQVLLLTKELLDEAKEADHILSLGLHPQKTKLINVSHSSYWLRDFAPFSLSVHESGFKEPFFVDFIFRAEHQIDDSVGYQMALFLKRSILHAPVNLDGGNFLWSGANCFATDILEKENFFSASKDNQENLERIFQSYFGCKTLFLLKSAPHEHIDMFAKFISPKVLLLNQIEEASVSFLEKKTKIDTELAGDLQKTKAVQKELEDIYLQLKAYFSKFDLPVEIVRIPMPIIETGIFRTYANSVIINGTVILPSFEKNWIRDQSYYDQDERAALEKRIESIYQSFGLKTVWVNGDFLIAHGGGFHCAVVGY